MIGLTFINSACRQQPEPLRLGIPVVYFPRANAFLARAQALLWVRDCSTHSAAESIGICSELYLSARNIFATTSRFSWRTRSVSILFQNHPQRYENSFINYSDTAEYNENLLSRERDSNSHLQVSLPGQTLICHENISCT